MTADTSANAGAPGEMLISGGRVITPFTDFTVADVLIADGRIKSVGEDLSGSVSPDAQRIDATGLTVIPGLIDLHTQGAGGADVWDNTPDALETWSRCLAEHGTTSFLVTTGYDTTGYELLTTHFDSAGAAAEPLGVYLESPFCSIAKRGGISEDRVQPVSIDTLNTIQGQLGDKLSMMTVAPEREGALEMIAELVKRGIIASIGHTDCSAEEAQAAIDAGANHVTHCFNAMRSLHHRDPGPLPVVLTDEGVYIELIVDGIHIHPAIIDFAVRVKGTSRTCVVTDNMRVAGLPEGEYEFVRMGRTIKVKVGDVPRLADGTISGSTLMMDQALRNVMKFTGLSLAEALPMLTAVPADSIGKGNRKGRLKPGFDADVLLLDDDLRVRRTLVRGRTVYDSH